MSQINLSLSSRLEGLLNLPAETEWVEFKHNNADPEAIGEYLSALSNSAILNDQPRAWLAWGICDADHTVVGTTFRPFLAKVGNQGLEGWLSVKTYPRLDFRIHEWDYELNIPDSDPSKATRIIKETMSAGLLKPKDPDSASRKHAKYLPFWA
jgi:hypothetical protein